MVFFSQGYASIVLVYLADHLKFISLTCTNFYRLIIFLTLIFHIQWPLTSWPCYYYIYFFHPHVFFWSSDWFWCLWLCFLTLLLLALTRQLSFTKSLSVTVSLKPNTSAWHTGMRKDNATDPWQGSTCSGNQTLGHPHEPIACRSRLRGRTSMEETEVYWAGF